MQAAIGLQQFERLDQLISSRTENAHYLTEQLKDVPGIITPQVPAWGERVYFYYLIRLIPEVLGTDMLNFALALSAEGVYDERYLSTTRWMVPQHLEPLFINKNGYGGTKCPFECPWYEGEVNYGPGMCPEAEKACEEVFWLASVHPLLKKQDLDDIANAVKKVASVFVERAQRGEKVEYATEAHRQRL